MNIYAALFMLIVVAGTTLSAVVIVASVPTTVRPKDVEIRAQFARLHPVGRVSLIKPVSLTNRVSLVKR